MSKTVIYYCGGCRQRIPRERLRSSEFYVSFCTTAGRPVRMRRLKDQPKALAALTKDNR